MTPEQRAVSSWLYSLNRVEWAIIDLDRSIDEIERRLSQGRIQATTFDRIFCSNSNISRPAEDGAMAEAGYSGDQERIDYLLVLRADYQRNLTDYESAMEKMVQDEKWGALANSIIIEKFRKKTVPDEKIYSNVVFCAERTYYWTLSKALDFFVDVLPSRFRKNCSFVAVKSTKSVVY